MYSLTSPYGHPHNTDTSLLRTVRLVPEMTKIIHSLPLQYGHLCKADSWFCPFGVRFKDVSLYKLKTCCLIQRIRNETDSIPDIFLDVLTPAFGMDNYDTN